MKAKHQEPAIVDAGFKSNKRGGWWYREPANRYTIQIVPSGKSQRGWLPHGETVLLMDGSKRYVRLDGRMCITLVRPDGVKSCTDSGFRHENELLDEVSKYPVVNPPAEVTKATEDLIVAGVSENTLRAYRRITKAIETWLNSRVLSDQLLAAYITHLHHTGKSPSTISQVIAAVKWSAKHQNLSLGELPVASRTLAGIRREGKTRGRGQVDGMIWSDVERVCAFAESKRTLSGLRDSAMIRLMSDCLLRVSEVVAVDVNDLKDKTLLVKESKTDQEAHGEMLYVCEQTRKIIKRYCTKANITNGALFRQVRKGDNITDDRLTDVSARRIIKQWALSAGVEGFISGHSLRVGSAVSLAQAGASVVDMQTAGRWKSSQMPAHYAKAELAERGAIARFKEKK